MDKLLEDVKRKNDAVSVDFDTVTKIDGTVVTDVFVIPVFYRKLLNEGSIGNEQRVNFLAKYCPFTGVKLEQESLFNKLSKP